MPCIGAALAHAYRANRQTQVIDEDKYVLQWNLLLLHPIADGVSTEIHVCRGLK